MRDAGPIIVLAEQSALLASLSSSREQPGKAWLSHSEKARLARISSCARQEEFLAARMALRLALATAYVGTSWQAWRVTSEEGHAPAVEGVGLYPDGLPPGSPCSTAQEAPSDGPRLSLTHSAGLLAVAVSRTPVGLDIELQRKPRPVTELLDLVASPQEQRYAATLSGHRQAAAFYRIWTLKEAYFKYRGSGLDWTMMRRLSTRMLPETSDTPAGTSPVALGAVWNGCHGAVPYTLALCTAPDAICEGAQPVLGQPSSRSTTPVPVHMPVTQPTVLGRTTLTPPDFQGCWGYFL